MNIELRYFDDCPNWKTADERLAALAQERPGLTVTRRLVDTAEEAERLAFTGSPMLLMDGVDLFPVPGGAPGLSCRRYSTPDGFEGAPTLDQLRAALPPV